MEAESTAPIGLFVARWKSSDHQDYFCGFTCGPVPLCENYAEYLGDQEATSGTA